MVFNKLPFHPTLHSNFFFFLFEVVLEEMKKTLLFAFKQMNGIFKVEGIGQGKPVMKIQENWTVHRVYIVFLLKADKMFIC